MENKIGNTPINYDTLLGIVRLRWGNFIVHMDTRQHRLEFECYPVTDWTDRNNEKGMSYTDKENEPDFRDVFETDKCLKKLEGSFCWRGVWEGRLYFPDDEYWDNELKKLSELYNDCILPWCKNFIKEREPNNCYD